MRLPGGNGVGGDRFLGCRPCWDITHAFTGSKEPLVMCMQGRRVVMQVESDNTKGLRYTARFYNLQRDVLAKKKIMFEANRDSNPEVRINDRPLTNEFPSSAAFDGLLTFTYPETDRCRRHAHDLSLHDQGLGHRRVAGTQHHRQAHCGDGYARPQGAGCG